MSQLPISEQEINRIINQVMRDVQIDYQPYGRTALDSLPTAADAIPPEHLNDLGTDLGNGLFATLDEAIIAARQAFNELQELPLSIRNKMITAIRKMANENNVILAQLAHYETGMGRAEDKVGKNWLVTNLTPGPEYLTTEAFTGDGGLSITEYAPFGFSGASSLVPIPLAL